MNYLNEARMNVRKMTAEELASTVLENKNGDKNSAIKYLKSYANSYFKPEDEIYKKIMKACEIINGASFHKTEKNDSKKESKKEYKEESNTTSNKLRGMTFTLTGKAIINGKAYTRNELTQIIENNGGKVVSINKNPTYLLTGDLDSNSAKMNYAHSRGIKIKTYNEFFNKFIFNKEESKSQANDEYSQENVKTWARGFFEDYRINKYDQTGYILMKLQNAQTYDEKTFWKNIYDEYIRLKNNYTSQNNYNAFSQENARKYAQDLFNQYKVNGTDSTKYIADKWSMAKNNNEETYWETVYTEYRNFKRAYDATNKKYSKFDSQNYNEVKNNIKFNINDKIYSDKLSYKSMLLKLHPDFHKDNFEEATEKAKLINLNKNNPIKLKEYARKWGLLRESLHLYSDKELYKIMLIEVGF